MTTTQAAARAARYTYPDLCHLDALIADHAARTPGYYAAPGEYDAWETHRDTLVADRDALVATLDGILCRKCQGSGRTRWRHRLDGICFQCDGDGWTARGRRAARKATP